MSFFLAALLLIDLPLGPGSEAIAHKLVAPYQHAEAIDGGPWHLWDIRVQPRKLIYRIGAPHQRPVVDVLVDLNAAQAGAQDAVGLKHSAEAPEGAILASQSIATQLRTSLAKESTTFHERAPPPVDHPVALPSSSAAAQSTKTQTTKQAKEASPPPSGSPRWLSALLLLALACSLVANRRRIAAGFEHLPPGTALIGGALSAALYGLLLLMDDVVLHPNAHGWDTVRSVAAFTETPFPLWSRYGSFVIESGRLFGIFAEPGRETFVASRVCAALAGFAFYALALALFTKRTPALLATGLFIASPALIYVGRGEALSACGLLFALLSAWLFALAARRRDLWLLGSAALALACLANFRLMGPLMAPFVALFALLPALGSTSADQGRPWWHYALAAWALAALISLPHLWQMAWMMVAEMAARPEAGVVPRTLIDSPLWTPSALTFAAAVGVVSLALMRRMGLAALLAVWLLVAIVAPAASAAYFQDQARYQVYALPALALLGAVALIRCAALPRLIAAGIALLWLTAFVWGLHLAGQVQATDHAEATQLRSWRTLATLLPADAWLVVPVETRGRARTALPDVELITMRPDLRLVSLDEARQAQGAALYYYEGLSCAARYPSDPEGAASDCLKVREAAN